MKVNRSLNLGLGILYVSNLGNPLVLPSVAVVYSSKNFLINVDFPVKIEFEGILAHGKFRPVLGVSFPASTYFLVNQDQNFSYLTTTGYLGIRYQVFDLLYLYGAYQNNLLTEFKLGNKDGLSNIGTMDGHNRIVIAIFFQVAKFINYTNTQ